MTDLSDTEQVKKIANEAFLLMEKSQGSSVSENIQIGEISIEKVEISEKNGHKMLHMKVDEDNEIWVVQKKNGERVIAVKDEESYVYYGANDDASKQVTVIGQEGLSAVLNTESGSLDKMAQKGYVQKKDQNKTEEYQYKIESSADGIMVNSQLVENGQKIAESEFSLNSASGQVKNKGYGPEGAFEGKGQLVNNGKKGEEMALVSKVENGVAIVDDEIWRCENGKLSLVGVINKEKEGTASINIGGRKVSYQPASSLSENDLALRNEPSQWQEEKIRAALGAKSITMQNILDSETWSPQTKAEVKQAMQKQSSQKGGESQQNPATLARTLRFNMHVDKSNNNKKEVIAKNQDTKSVDKKVTVNPQFIGQSLSEGR